ncbi:DNA-binding response regulator, NarL/FixJ family, contains REC and HTH domains [Tenacibaculum sp. MAR_2009_124]|uniref:response regulator transcription factor n=1 Tax=Tenacibaculum sp. MAR_2009_124 TaxID=1250059 RepID=UPI000898B0BC|nr:response regulator transcription factor [Tenacibaculum sp. MAR_2009_124]SEC65837.1 DNA-binding response regulator, NarL/FixJ family, contains REC and HTH domains [Tenacibaculum sp. MAR_2009_124]
MSKRIRIHIAEDHPLVKDGIVSLLDKVQIEVVGFTQNGMETIKWFENNQADVLILDLSLPIINGTDLLKYFKENDISTNVLIHTADGNSGVIKEVYKIGALGYILKDDNKYDINEAIINVYNGKFFFSEGIDKTLIQEAQDEIFEENYVNEALNDLSKRQKEVLEIIGDSYDYNGKIISTDLGISPSTLRDHIRNIKKKLNIDTKAKFQFIKIAINFAKGEKNQQ